MRMDIKNKVIDIHAHILPGVDDGCRTMEESCRMLELAAGQGVVAVIATPHYSRSQNCGELRGLADQLQRRIREVHPDFTVYVGQESYFHEELVDALKLGTAFTMNDSRYILVEFQPEVSYRMLYRGVRQLLLSGHVPVLAHMERYQCLRNDKNLTDLMGSGCRLQMNYGSIQGRRFHPDVRWCRQQILQGRVHLLGTDMHRMDYRPPELGKAIGWLAGHVEAGLIELMTYENPLKIIKNEQMS